MTKEKNMDNNIEKAYICPQCGANDIELISEELGKCSYCGTKISFPKEKDVQNVVNEIHIHAGGNAAPAVSFYAIRPTITKEEFVRAAYIDLAMEKTTPTDIFDSEFGLIETEYRKFLKASCQTQVSYSVTIGYDRKEEYEEYNRSLGKYETKTRTVTDWKPFNGSKNACLSSSLDTEDDSDESEIMGLSFFDYTLSAVAAENLVPYDKVDFETEAPPEPTPRLLQRIKNNCVRKLKFTCQDTLPGDQNKDFSANGSVSAVETITSIVIPQYVLPYKYKGKEYSYVSFAAGRTAEHGNNVNVSEKISNMADDKNKYMLFISLALTILSVIVSFTVPLLWLKILSFSLSVATFVAWLILGVVLKRKIIAAMKAEKLEKLNDFLFSHGFKPLTAEEKELF